MCSYVYAQSKVVMVIIVSFLNWVHSTNHSCCRFPLHVQLTSNGKKIRLFDVDFEEGDDDD